ncbi:MAG: 1,4-alpha-glucan branching protein GlgB [Candidatus Nanopelagicaceae bacterium]|nr:1,4-alpha-glucan branching protein GlgB [Candidatus Nanopelagicaceae bacterium]
MCSLGEIDLYLIGEGRHEKLWEVLGSHIRYSSTGLVSGTTFAVWAPNAREVSLICDANYWDRNTHKLSPVGKSGIWELFVPNVGEGLRYKYAILQRDGKWTDHADPLARRTESPPLTASIVFESNFQWSDQEWMTRRKSFQSWKQPVSIYEVHLGSWKLGLSYNELAVELIDYVRNQGFTHVEFLPVMEHPYGPSWGYQVTSFFAPTSRFGSPDDFRHLIDALHWAGIGVILDWVPAHFPKDEWALAKFDGTALYEHADPRLGEHPDWGTLIFNFGRTEVKNFLVASALFWLTEFHIDGLRVDAVASMLYLDYSRKEGEWLPNKFGGRENLEAVALLQEATSTAYRTHPGIMMIAEESTAWSGVSRSTDSGGLGFGYKWNMGWMHDTLSYLQEDPVNRVHHHNEVTFSILYAWSENYVLPISHDEVVHGKASLVNKFPGDRWQKLATMRALYGFMWAHPGKKLLFMGCEFAQSDEWNESLGLQWHLTQYDEHKGIQRSIKALNDRYVATPSLWEKDTSPEGFTWLVNNDAPSNILAFVRWDESRNPLVCVTNFSPVPHEWYEMTLPVSGNWKEAMNTDDVAFGGSGISNEEITSHVESGNRVRLRIPPLATLWLERS